jgi:hypothetical protein
MSPRKLCANEVIECLLLAHFRHLARSNPRLLSGGKADIGIRTVSHPHCVRVSALRATIGPSNENEILRN